MKQEDSELCLDEAKLYLIQAENLIVKIKPLQDQAGAILNKAKSMREHVDILLARVERLHRMVRDEQTNTSQ